jgi:cytochrome c oxidase subunit 2
LFINLFSIEFQTLEIIWTTFPTLILILLGLPRLSLLYRSERNREINHTLKVIGNQWYWSYQYSDLPQVEFDSFLTPRETILTGNYRLLEVDNKVILPINVSTRILVGSNDVLHAWALPRLGVKVDATPGRLNQTFIYSSFPGLFYGQCSEICGANHRFIPISVEVVPIPSFKLWLSLFSWKTNT